MAEKVRCSRSGLSVTSGLQSFIPVWVRDNYQMRRCQSRINKKSDESTVLFCFRLLE